MVNYKNHLTHYGGKAIKTMSREELIEALTAEYNAHNSVIEEWNKLRRKNGASIEIYG